MANEPTFHADASTMDGFPASTGPNSGTEFDLGSMMFGNADNSSQNTDPSLIMEYTDGSQGTPAETIPNQAQPPVDAKSDPERFQYWQSQAAIMQNQVASAAPIMALAQTDPDVRQLILQKLSGVQQPNQAVQAPEVKPPTPPVRPTDYNDADRLNPESSTFKYLLAKEQYLEQNMEFLSNQNQQLQSAVSERLRQEAASREELAAKQSYHAQLVNKYGMQPDEAVEYMKFMDSPDSLRPENMIVYFRAMQQARATTARPQQGRQPAYAPAPRPIPGGAGPTGAQQPSANDMFNQTMKSWIPKRAKIQ